MKKIMTRSMFCEHCNAHDHPTKGDTFLVYGSTSKKIHERICETYARFGYTPHLIGYDEPPVVKNYMVEITASCGVCEIGYELVNGVNLLKVYKAHAYRLSLKDFNALVKRCKHLGYDI